MQKFENVDILKSLKAIMQTHTEFTGLFVRLFLKEDLQAVVLPVGFHRAAVKEARTAAKTEKKPSIRAQLAQDKEALKNAPKKAAEKSKKQDLEVQAAPGERAFSPSWRLCGLLSVSPRGFSRIKALCRINGQRHR